MICTSQMKNRKTTHPKNKDDIFHESILHSVSIYVDITCIWAQVFVCTLPELQYDLSDLVCVCVCLICNAQGLAKKSLTPPPPFQYGVHKPLVPD